MITAVLLLNIEQNKPIRSISLKCHMKLKKNENNIPKYCKSATHKNFIKNCFNGNNIPKNKAKGLGHV